MVKFTAAVDELLHTVWLATALTTGVGFTVMVKVIGAPTQVVTPSVNVGVTLMIAVTGALPLLMPVNDAILPDPLAARPMDGSLLVQL